MVGIIFFRAEDYIGVRAIDFIIFEHSTGIISPFLDLMELFRLSVQK